MANAYITAVFRCSKFRGITRNVLLYLADAASPGQGEDKKNLPLGFCKRKRASIMIGVNCHRRVTISAAIAELKAAGAITQWRKKNCSAMYRVNLDWLKEQAYTDDELALFKDPEEEVTESDTSPAGEARVARGHTAGTSEPPVDIRKPLLPDNGKRNFLETESATVEVRKPLPQLPTLFPPSLRAGVLTHPPVEGNVPPASQEKSMFHTDDDKAEDQLQGQLQQQDPQAWLSTADDSPATVAPQAKPSPVPPPFFPLAEKYVPKVDFTNQTNTHSWHGKSFGGFKCCDHCGVDYKAPEASQKPCPGKPAPKVQPKVSLLSVRDRNFGSHIKWNDFLCADCGVNSGADEASAHPCPGKANAAAALQGSALGSEEIPF